jgi:hypothetical protein
LHRAVDLLAAAHADSAAAVVASMVVEADSTVAADTANRNH